MIQVTTYPSPRPQPAHEPDEQEAWTDDEADPDADGDEDDEGSEFTEEEVERAKARLSQLPPIPQPLYDITKSLPDAKNPYGIPINLEEHRQAWKAVLPSLGTIKAIDRTSVSERTRRRAQKKGAEEVADFDAHRDHAVKQYLIIARILLVVKGEGTYGYQLKEGDCGYNYALLKELDDDPKRQRDKLIRRMAGEASSWKTDPWL